MGYELRMSAEIHDWLANLRSEDPPPRRWWQMRSPP
jgi:hypothetical protein